MEIQMTQWYSERLGREMPVKRYGQSGKPCLVIPSQNGNCHDFEGFGMVEACSSFIESGRLQLFCVDAIDAETWSCEWKNPRERIEQHECWVQYLLQEVTPFLEQYANGQKAMTLGCSMGAYHAGNIFFRFPDRFDACVCLSGLYDAASMLNGYMDDLVYLNSPCHCLQNLPPEHPYMELYRQSKIFICVGQGAWEDQLLAGTRQLDAVLRSRGIPAFVDYWGYDVNHDWPWWRVQAPYFLDKIL
ncbi:MAG: esterase [Lachnospiraceae bacterium]|nr:esterase [Lachnospiraceae bacterium]